MQHAVKKRRKKKTIEAFMMKHNLFLCSDSYWESRGIHEKYSKETESFCVSCKCSGMNMCWVGSHSQTPISCFPSAETWLFLPWKAQRRTLPRPEDIAQCGSGLWVRAGAKRGSAQTLLTVPALLLLLHESCSKATNPFRGEEESPPGVLASLSALSWTVV